MRGLQLLEKKAKSCSLPVLLPILIYRGCPGGPKLRPPGRHLVHYGVSLCARAVLVPLGEGSWLRVSPHGSDKFPAERFTVVCWRMSLNTNLPSRIVPDPYRIGNGCTRSTTFPSTSTSPFPMRYGRSEEHTSELQSHLNLVCRLLLEKKKHQLSQHC